MMMPVNERAPLQRCGFLSGLSEEEKELNMLMKFHAG